jgi:hypothetical protein
MANTAINLYQIVLQGKRGFCHMLLPHRRDSRITGFSMIKKVALALSGLTLLTLAGCGWNEKPGVITACPRIGVLYDAARKTEFASGSSTEISNLAFDAEVSDAFTDCEYEGDQVISNIEFALDMWAGPAARNAEKDFTYFVAITELNQRVITKEYFTYRANFENARRVYDIQEIKNISIPYKRLGRGDLYEILIGWDLTPEQIEYNRTHTPFEKPNLRRMERP